MLKKIISWLSVAAMLLPTLAIAQFVPGQVLSAGQLNNAFSAVLPLAGGTMTGPLTTPSLAVSGTATLPNLQYSPAWTSATTRTVQQRLQDRISVKDFGCDSTGASDTTACIQRAINFIASTGNVGQLFFPAGTYLVSGTLNITSAGIYLVGDGPYRTTIQTSSSTADVVKFNGNFFGGGVSNLSIYNPNTTTPTAGAGINVTTASDTSFRNVEIKGTYNGVVTNQTGIVKLSHVSVSQAIYDSFQINGGPGQFLEYVSAYNDSPNHAGVNVTATGMLHLSHSAIDAQGTALLVAPTTATGTPSYYSGQVFDLFVDNNDFDASQGDAVVIKPTGTGVAYSLQFTNNRIGFSSGAGLVIDGSNLASTSATPYPSGVYNVTFSNLQSVKNVKEGVKIVNGTNVQIDGSSVIGNSSTGSGYAGISVLGGDAITISGTHATQYTNVGNNQTYGLQIASTFTGRLNASNNFFADNQTGSINNLSSSQNVKLANNTGYDVFSIGGNQFYPSLWNTRAFYNMVVPNSGVWYDNVITIQNNSIAPDTGVSGNAAFRFVDNVNGIERGAFGYSRVSTGTSGGFYPDLLYAEVGNLTAGDPDDTDFGIIVTHSSGASSFPGSSLVAMRVVSKTGDINFNTQGSGAVNVGTIGTPTPFTIGMQNSLARFRERDNTNNFAITTNVGLSGAQDSTSIPSWEMSIGGTDDEFHIGRIPAGGTSSNKLPNRFSVSGTTGTVTATGPVKTAGYTVATLPAGTIGMRAYVTDATSCTFMGSLTGGGSTVCPTFYNGTAWVAE
ncbi:glycosyl hydrolase family 28-related protein [Burkholderia cepacia]|uniref:glycosyl hydrolase family 28-related protein n=1 Tax=Burkholderia cepacia TaxID=292 RepID=UPI0009C0F6AD|nr:glycosyl hydrolase family 28-related protein [Burkholderia cepacia]